MLRFFVFVTVLSLPSIATVVRIDPLTVMSKKSDVIVQGIVAKQEKTQDEEGRPITLTTIDVLDGIKGAQAGGQVLVYQVGGEQFHIEGAHHYTVGEEIVIFGLSFEDKIVSYGLGIGKFRIIQNAREKKILEELGDVITIKPGLKGDFGFETPIPRRYDSLDLFKRQIRQNMGSAFKIPINEGMQE